MSYLFDQLQQSEEYWLVASEDERRLDMFKAAQAGPQQQGRGTTITPPQQTGEWSEGQSNKGYVAQSNNHQPLYSSSSLEGMADSLPNEWLPFGMLDGYDLGSSNGFGVGINKGHLVSFGRGESSAASKDDGGDSCLEYIPHPSILSEVVTPPPTTIMPPPSKPEPGVVKLEAKEVWGEAKEVQLEAKDVYDGECIQGTHTRAAASQQSVHTRNMMMMMNGGMAIPPALSPQTATTTIGGSTTIQQHQQQQQQQLLQSQNSLDDDAWSDSMDGGSSTTGESAWEGKSTRGGGSSSGGGGATGTGGGADTKHHNSKHQLIPDKRRIERNAREQRRSLRISVLIDELRGLLVQNGHRVKGSKSSVLEEATVLIRQLSAKVTHLEAERVQFVGLLEGSQAIGVPPLGVPLGGLQGGASYNSTTTTTTTTTDYNVALPVRSSVKQQQQQQQPPMSIPPPMTPVPSTSHIMDTQEQQTTTLPLPHMSKIRHQDYRNIFHHAAVPMAVASISGSILDCNKRMAMSTGHTLSEMAGLTIFNLVADQLLQEAFALINAMLTSVGTGQQQQRQHFEVLGKMKNGQPAGILSIVLVIDDTGQPAYMTICLTPTPTLILR